MAANVAISGTPNVGQTLTGSYTYGDVDGDLQAGSTYRWLRNGIPIGGETATAYTLTGTDVGQSITFEVTPGAATGTTPGAPATSPAITPS